jgi:phage baseplate assembly protein W
MRLSYPLTVENGRVLTTATLADRVDQDIRSAVLTRQEERVMRPSYGVDEDLLSTPSLPDVLREYRKAIARGLSGYQGVTFGVSGSIRDDGYLDLEVNYTIPEGQGVTQLIV